MRKVMHVQDHHDTMEAQQLKQQPNQALQQRQRAAASESPRSCRRSPPRNGDSEGTNLSTSDFQREVGEVFGEIGGELPAKFGRRFSSFFCWENRQKHFPPKLHRKLHHQTSLRGSGLWRAQQAKKLLRRPHSTNHKVVQGKRPLHFVLFNGAVCSNTLFSNTALVTNSLSVRANSTFKSSRPPRLVEHFWVPILGASCSSILLLGTVRPSRLQKRPFYSQSHVALQ